VAVGRDIAPAIAPLYDAGIPVCAFVDPVIEQIQAAAQCNMHAVELCTTAYAASTNRRLARLSWTSSAAPQ